jgi:hypothetical protein
MPVSDAATLGPVLGCGDCSRFQAIVIQQQVAGRRARVQSEAEREEFSFRD